MNGTLVEAASPINKQLPDAGAQGQVVKLMTFYDIVPVGLIC